jgi:hypothetical protein
MMCLFVSTLKEGNVANINAGNMSVRIMRVIYHRATLNITSGIRLAKAQMLNVLVLGQKRK